MSERFGGHGFGNVGLGVAGEPSKTRTRPDLCAGLGHPGATYNPIHDVTSCLCGKRWQEGDQSSHVACCDGPLVERLA